MNYFGQVCILCAVFILLLMLAKGLVDLYKESSILLWDVVASLAIVEWAGGSVSATKAREEQHALNVEASNGKISFYRN